MSAQERKFWGYSEMKKISEMVELLKSAQEKYGDLPVVVHNAVETRDYATSVELVTFDDLRHSERERIKVKKFVVIT